jgi:hypothetical protein
MRKRFLCPALLCLALVTPSMHAFVITASPNLLPAGGSYDGPGWTFHSGLNDADFINVFIYNFSPTFAPPQSVGLTATNSFNAAIAGDYILNGGAPTHAVVNAQGQYFIQKISGPNGSSLGTYDTEMLLLTISSGLPGGALLRESPTLASDGQTTESDAGGGLFRIDSFFDIFVELSLDGGQSWIPSSGSSHQTLGNVPEPASLSLIPAGLFCLGVFRGRARQTRRLAP